MSRRKQNDQQTESHDWRGEFAEKYVAFVIAEAIRKTKQSGDLRDPVHYWVYGGSKWGADIAVIKRVRGKGLQLVRAIEVRTNKRRVSTQKARRCDALVRLKFEGFRVVEMDFHGEPYRQSARHDLRISLDSIGHSWAKDLMEFLDGR